MSRRNNRVTGKKRGKSPTIPFSLQNVDMKEYNGDEFWTDIDNRSVDEMKNFVKQYWKDLYKKNIRVKRIESWKDFVKGTIEMVKAELLREDITQRASKRQRLIDDGDDSDDSDDSEDVSDGEGNYKDGTKKKKVDNEIEKKEEKDDDDDKFNKKFMMKMMEVMTENIKSVKELRNSGNNSSSSVCFQSPSVNFHFHFLQ